MSDELVDIHLLGFPVDLFQRSRQHHDELLREFALIGMGEQESVPAKLLALSNEVVSRFSDQSAVLREQVDAAVARGDDTTDVVLPTASSAGPLILALNDVLDRADAFCREGGALLTLATPPELLAFRRWYLGQIVDQLSGRPPVPWVGAAFVGSGPIELSASMELAPEAASASAARRFVRETLASWGASALEEAAILLTSEVVTNALLHARTPMRLLLRRRDGLLRVEVCDESDLPPERRHYEADASTGRGLALVEALADDWGVDPADGGKSVWFTLSMEAAQ